MSPDSLTLRRFLPEDRESVVELFRAAVWRVNSRDYSLEQIAVWAPAQIDAEALSRRLAASFCLVAELAGQVVGFGNLESSGHLDCLYAHADFQRQGIGSALLCGLEQWAREQHLPRLFTEASITAVPFFEARGYVVLAKQQVPVRGILLTNFRMEKVLEHRVQ